MKYIYSAPLSSAGSAVNNPVERKTAYGDKPRER